MPLSWETPGTVALHSDLDIKGPKVETSFRAFNSGGYIEIFPSSVFVSQFLFFCNACYGVRIASTGDFAYGLSDLQSLPKTPHYPSISLSTSSHSSYSCQPLKYRPLCVIISIYCGLARQKIFAALSSDTIVLNGPWDNAKKTLIFHRYQGELPLSSNMADQKEIISQARADLDSTSTVDSSLEAFSAPLHRRLKSRHIQMIAIGGIIGPGLLVGSGNALHLAGPAGTLISFSLVGIIVFFVMQSLGELATLIPVTGSFTEYASRFVDDSLSFGLGWAYWVWHSPPRRVRRAVVILSSRVDWF